jgi:hypothetical protein
LLTQYEAIIQAFEELNKTITIKEMEEYIRKKYGAIWKDFGTVMAGMVSASHGGNHSSTVPSVYQVLKRISRGKYELMKNNRGSLF